MAENNKVEVQPENEVLDEQTVQPEQVFATTEATLDQQSVQDNGVDNAGESFGVKAKRWFKKLGANLTERCRKGVVALKRKPQSIVLYALFISTVLWLIWLFSFSRTISKNSAADWCGLVVFITTLVSILILALFGSAFPKRKKPNLIFIALLFVFMAAIIACDIVYYIQMDHYIKFDSQLSDAQLLDNPYIQQSLNYAIVHVVLIGICALLLATLPLYKRLINMINTTKEVKSNEIKEVIDVEED